MKLIDRNQYLDKLINVMGTPDIKVITGVRRSGKSKLLEAFRDYVEEEIPDHNIIHINFNLPEYDHLLEYRPLYDYVKAQYIKGKQNFVLMLFFDLQILLHHGRQFGHGSTPFLHSVVVGVCSE